MLSKDLKTKTTISNSVKTEIVDNLKIYYNDTGIPLSKLLEKAISLFLESTKK